MDVAIAGFTISVITTIISLSIVFLIRDRKIKFQINKTIAIVVKIIVYDLLMSFIMIYFARHSLEERTIISLYMLYALCLKFLVFKILLEI
jgi:hypothetical protein